MLVIGVIPRWFAETWLCEKEENETEKPGEMEYPCPRTDSEEPREMEYPCSHTDRAKRRLEQMLKLMIETTRVQSKVPR